MTEGGDPHPVSPFSPVRGEHPPGLRGGVIAGSAQRAADALTGRPAGAGGPSCHRDPARLRQRRPLAPPARPLAPRASPRLRPPGAQAEEEHLQVSTGVGAGGRGAVGGVEALCFTPPTPGRSISQNSSILPEEEDEKSCTESELRVSRRRSLARRDEVRAPQSTLVMSRGTWGWLGTRGSGWGLPLVALPPSLKMPEGDGSILAQHPPSFPRTLLAGMWCDARE